MRTIRTYNFDIRLSDDRAAYNALCDKLKAKGLQCVESPQSHYRKELDGLTVTCSGNVWRTDTGLNVFEWAQDYRPNSSLTIKRGYYLTT